MEPDMLAALDHYIAHASTVQLVCTEMLAIIVIGLGPFVPVWVADQFLAARRASQGIR